MTKLALIRKLTHALLAVEWNDGTDPRTYRHCPSCKHAPPHAVGCQLDAALKAVEARQESAVAT